jgi:hypothetical protein
MARSIPMLNAFNELTMVMADAQKQSQEESSVPLANVFSNSPEDPKGTDAVGR